jgi:hypothetical protein
MPGDANMTMMERVQLRPIRPGELAGLVAAAREDAHECVLPSHVVLKGGEIIGYVGLVHHVCLANVWMHSQKAGPLDSLAGLTALEALAAEHGNTSVLLPCDTASPYWTKLEKLGYRKLLESTITVKPLN